MKSGSKEPRINGINAEIISRVTDMYIDFIRKGIEKKKENRKRQDGGGDSKPKKDTPGARGAHFRKEVVEDMMG
ncbi:hypothetical protein ROHU_032238 [Labeo rohita]|uniref:Uncharacterized protein n=1 Tax=Labeo rohita TaxID=84645 RepID=A0A498LKK5_LABRO|nr:hypothetical protein ROHU_032238 [Labeo rohita]